MYVSSAAVLRGHVSPLRYLLSPLQQNRQDAVWEAQQAARDKLQAQVAEIRGKQIALKQQQQEWDLHQQSVDKQFVEQAATEAAQLEMEFREQKVRTALRHRLDLEA